MDVTEKDAARAKWKLTQRHKRGRGGGPGRGRGGGQQASGGTAEQRLGNNQDRYEDEAPADGRSNPVVKSEGADLAELLRQAGSYDVAYYRRQRVNLVEEYGLPPPDAASYQGLSFDLKGLAACLSALPLHSVLQLTGMAEGGDTAEEQLAQMQIADGSGGEVGVARRPPATHAPAAERSQPPAATMAQPARSEPYAAAAPIASAAQGGDQLEDLLGGSGISGPARAATATSAPPLGQAAAAGADSSDGELDALLGLGPSPQSRREPVNAGNSQAADLEAWLDAL